MKFGMLSQVGLLKLMLHCVFFGVGGGGGGIHFQGRELYLGDAIKKISLRLET